MSLLTDIAGLEDFIAEVLATQSEAKASDRRVREAATQAIIDILTEQGLTVEDFQDAEMQQRIEEAIREALSGWMDELHTEIAENVRTIAERTHRFYEPFAVPDLRTAAARSAVTQKISEALEEGLRHIRQRLARVTIEKAQEAFLQGEIDHRALADSIEKEAETTTRFARVQSTAAVTGYNQAHRNVIAEKAGLEHWHYNGTLQTNSRPFCRIHIGRVFTTEQVLAMRNSMLEPVMLFKGGFNCRHSWLPVNPDWDPQLKEKLVDADPEEVCLDAACNHKIVVVAGPPRIDRLNKQIPLQRRGYILFEDAASNDTGFVAVHEEWWWARLDARAGTKRRKAYDDELGDARRRAEEGEEVRLFIPEDED